MYIFSSASFRCRIKIFKRDPSFFLAEAKRFCRNNEPLINMTMALSVCENTKFISKLNRVMQALRNFSVYSTHLYDTNRVLSFVKLAYFIDKIARRYERSNN